MSLTVVDASVFNKLFLDEPDRPQAVAFFRHMLTEGLPFGAPEYLKLEACQSALHYGHDFSVPLDLLEKYTEGGFQWIELGKPHWAKAQEISRDGNPKAGYPTLLDSLYHAAAIVEGGIFLTADAKHAKKAVEYGHLTLLTDWTS